MIKIEVDTVKEAFGEQRITVNTEINVTRGDAVGEIYSILKHFEMEYPKELTRALTLFIIKHSGEKDG